MVLLNCRLAHDAEVMGFDKKKKLIRSLTSLGGDNGEIQGGDKR